MSHTFAEILIVIATSLGAGLLLFVAGPLQDVMNELDEATFQRFLGRLEHHAMRSPFALTVSLITVIAAIPYFIAYGFGNGWFTAGIVVWVIGSVASKVLNLPVYKRVAALESTDTVRLQGERRKLQTANHIRAAITFLSVVLMVIGFI